MSEKILDKETEQILELLMCIGSKTGSFKAYSLDNFSTVNQFPLEKNYFKETEQDIRYEKFPEVTKMNQCTKSRQEQSQALNEKRSCLVL